MPIKLTCFALNVPGKACEAKGVQLDDVGRELDEAIKAAEAKSVKRQTKVQWPEHIVFGIET